MAAPIRRSPGHGKKIDTLHYDLVSPAGGAKKTVEMHLFMVKEFKGDEPPYETTGLSFSLRCDEPEMSVTGTDPNILVSALRSRLDRALAIDWQSWFIVKVDPNHPYRGEGRGFTMSWEEVMRGTDHEGRDLMRQRDIHRHEWVVEAWPETFRDRAGRTLAAVRGTPENEAALRDFAARIDSLRKQLALFVMPDNIEKTLAAIAAGGFAALPAPQRPQASDEEMEPDV